MRARSQNTSAQNRTAGRGQQNNRSRGFVRSNPGHAQSPRGSEPSLAGRGHATTQDEDEMPFVHPVCQLVCPQMYFSALLMAFSSPVHCIVESMLRQLQVIFPFCIPLYLAEFYHFQAIQTRSGMLTMAQTVAARTCTSHFHRSLSTQADLQSFTLTQSSPACISASAATHRTRNAISIAITSVWSAQASLQPKSPQVRKSCLK